MTTKQKLEKALPGFDPEAMNQEEKGYWLELLPSMTEEQALRLLTIIETHETKTAEVERKYGKAMQDLNGMHLTEWKELEEGTGILKELTA